MDLAMILSTAWRSLIVNKMRSALTALGIIIGVASVIMMVALSQGATAGVTERIASMGTNVLTVVGMGGPGAMRGAGSNTLKIEDVQAISTLPYVKNVAPSVDVNVTLAVGSLTWSASVQGTTSEMQSIREWEPAQGSFFTQDDVNNMAMVAVIGPTVAENLFPGTKNLIGSKLLLNGLTFTVVGVLPAQGSTGMGSDQDNAVYIPLTTAQTRLNGNNSIRMITVQAEKTEVLNFLKEVITSMLRQRHRLAEDAEDDFRIMDNTQLLETVEDTSRILTILLGGIAAVSLLVGGIGVMNIMLVSVTERTREIGIRMAIGATTGDILRQFLAESAMLCLIGGVIGTMLGIGFSWIFGKVSGWTMQVSSWSVIMALIFSMAVGIGFGYYPARKAAQSDPIEALRFE